MNVPSPILLKRRAFLVATGAACLVGCGPNSTMGLLRDTASLGLKGSKDYARTREEIEALPYAQMGLRIGGGAPGILVLAGQVQSDLQWVSANRIMVATRDGRVVRTVGLPIDLSLLRPQSPDLLARYDFLNLSLGESESTFLIDFGTQYSAPVTARFKVEKSETIDILGQRVETLRVREKIESDSLRWQATNTHWLSKRSALIWRSRQHLVPGQAPLQLELLKRPPA